MSMGHVCVEMERAEHADQGLMTKSWLKGEHGKLGFVPDFLWFW